ncbi:MAG: limonene-1,2-epoxide hydrolase family protein [Jatrophihabitans sp.]|uniref:limonene-1,2-epoxide hydrolase family protein n=1 Tax=Jatrophihabitans sp. TaxID=1932789 RepID=UPI003F801F99
MPSGLLPNAAVDPKAVSANPQTVVEAFLAALVAGDAATAGALLADDVRYVNVGLPAVHGRRATLRVLAPLLRGASRPVGFELYLHAISGSGPVVLTERTDVVTVGPLRLQFWVAGRFDVYDGQITLWRDSFDYLDCTRALVRAVVGAVIPPLRPKAPGSTSTPPGRHAH